MSVNKRVRDRCINIMGTVLYVVRLSETIVGDREEFVRHCRMRDAKMCRVWAVDTHVANFISFTC